MTKEMPTNIHEARMPPDIEDRYFNYFMSRFDEGRLNRTLADRLRRQWRHWISWRSRGLRPHFFSGLPAYAQREMAQRYTEYYFQRLRWKAMNTLRNQKIKAFERYL